jgi:hypothetical protein
LCPLSLSLLVSVARCSLFFQLQRVVFVHSSLECSAMVDSVFGASLDLHTGMNSTRATSSKRDTLRVIYSSLCRQAELTWPFPTTPTKSRNAKRTDAGPPPFSALDPLCLSESLDRSLHAPLTPSDPRVSQPRVGACVSSHGTPSHRR